MDVDGTFVPSEITSIFSLTSSFLKVERIITVSRSFCSDVRCTNRLFYVILVYVGNLDFSFFIRP